MAVFLFDMDGLLLDTERLHHDAFLDATQYFGISSAQDTPFFVSLVGCSTQMTRDRLHGYLPVGTATAGFLEVWNRAAHDRIRNNVPLRPFVNEVLSHLKSDHHRLAVVTSTPGNLARDHLGRAGLLQYFDGVTGGDEVSANKPDPAPYVETALALDVAPEKCFAFEDSDRGIASAVGAGCISTQIPDMRPEDAPLPDLGQHVATDLRAAVRTLGFL